VVVERQVHEPYGAPIAHGATDGPGFTGHVEDSATELTYMQQRYYDPQVGRFLSVDPVTPYSRPNQAFNRQWYASDNPYRFTDPDGREVQVKDKEQQKKIAGLINERSRGKFAFDKSGKLKEVKSSKGASDGGSSKYQSALRNAIASDKVITVEISETVTDASSGQELNVDRDLGGGATGRTSTGAQIVVSGNSNGVAGQDGRTILSTAADTLGHEFVAHALPIIGYPGSGNGITNENEVRRELGLPLRREMAHPEIR
jgi:RHS repeat-associated protein